MEPRDKQRSLQQDEVEAPTIEHQDWDALEGSKVLPDSVVAENDTPDTWEPEGTLPEEDDDNATRTATKPCPTRKRSASCHETRPGRELVRRGLVQCLRRPPPKAIFSAATTFRKASAINRY